jgi:hypothetical protein
MTILLSVSISYELNRTIPSVISNPSICSDWGQNSYGAVNANDPANWQKTLSYYCQDDTIDVIPIAFLNKFFSTGGDPEINLANVSFRNQLDSP